MLKDHSFNFSLFGIPLSVIQSMTDFITLFPGVLSFMVNTFFLAKMKVSIMRYDVHFKILSIKIILSIKSHKLETQIWNLIKTVWGNLYLANRKFKQTKSCYWYYQGYFCCKKNSQVHCFTKVSSSSTLLISFWQLSTLINLSL